MKVLRAILSKSKADYGAWFENLDGVYGAGETVAEAKENLLAALALYAKHNTAVPLWMKNNAYRIVYRFDSPSLFNYYKGIFTNAALERITGINQRQIQHYASGLKKPREAQRRKIEMAFRKLGSELMSLEL